MQPPRSPRSSGTSFASLLRGGTLAVAALTAGLVASFAPQAPAQQTDPLQGRQYAPDRVLVVLSESLPEQPETLDLSSAFANDPAMRAALARFGAHDMYRVFRDLGPTLLDSSSFHALGMHRHYVIELGENSNLGEALRVFEACPSIASARVDQVVRVDMTPNDPLYPQQWDAHQASDADIDADLAWDITTGIPSVIIAIVDTGCDYNHPDLAGALLPGHDYVNNDNNAQDDNGHGTSCAGIAAARANNGIGVAGVASGCLVLPVKALNSGGSGTYGQVASAITYAANNGAKVISMSLTGPCCDASVDTALAYAASLDVLSVAATGNNNASSIGYPASSTNCMAIGASSPCDERKNPSSCDGENFWGSNWGTGIDCIAPGVQIRTTSLGGGYTNSFNGTSAATPHAAGVAALIRSVDTSLTYSATASILQSSSEDQVGPPSEDTPGYDLHFGFGRINAHRAVLAAMSSTIFCFGDGSGAPPPCGNVGGPDSGCANSAGPGAQLNVSGTNSAGADNLVLRATNLPLNKAGLMLAGAGQGGGVPFNDGILCVTSGGVGVFRLPATNSGPTGVLVEGPGIGAYACTHWGSGCITAGQNWRFQAWYRDPTGPCSLGANLSNAIGVTFRP